MNVDDRRIDNLRGDGDWKGGFCIEAYEKGAGLSAGQRLII
jgi:hypothetical protein